MFKILDRYIFAKFLKTYFSVSALLLAIIIVIDITEKNDSFIEHKLTLDTIIWDYYINFVPYVVNLISPLTTFISVVVVTAELSIRTEIIAALSSGITFIRFLRPYFYGACVLTVINLYSNLYVLPPATKKRIAFENKYVHNPFYFSNKDIHMQENDSTLVYLHSYDNQTEIGSKFSMERIKGNQLIAKLDAENITWNDSTKKWNLNYWKLRQFDSLGERFSYGQHRDTVLRFLPKDFDTQHDLQLALDADELDEKIKDIQIRGLPNLKVFVVEKGIRIMTPFATLVLTFIGVVISSKKRRGGTGSQIALGFLMCFAFTLFVFLSRGIAMTSDWVYFTLWLPNISFSFIGFLLYKNTPK